MFKKMIAFTTVAFLALGLASAVQADDVATPTGDVILTVTLNNGASDATKTVSFDREMLEALGLTTIDTTTIWTDGLQNFEGVEIRSLLEMLDIQDGRLLATATNDYTVEIPVSDAVEGGPIIAMMLNGAPMSLRDKGPLWVVYPYDASADYRTEVIYSRSIWQLDRIEIVE